MRRLRLSYSIKALLALTALAGLPLVWSGRQIYFRRLEAIAERDARASSLLFETTRLAVTDDASLVARAETSLFGPRVTKLTVKWDSGIHSDCLSPFTELTELYFAKDSRAFRDLSKLAHMKSLEILDLEETSTEDLRPLASLAHLRRLYLRTTHVSDLGPLLNLQSLRGLYLDDTPTEDLGPISGLKDLEVLSIRGTKVSNLKPLQSLSNLVELDVTNVPLLDLHIIESLPKLELLHRDE